MCLHPSLYSLFPHDITLCNDRHCGLVATIALLPSIVPAWYTARTEYLRRDVGEEEVWTQVCSPLCLSQPGATCACMPTSADSPGTSLS